MVRGARRCAARGCLVLACGADLRRAGVSPGRGARRDGPHDGRGADQGRRRARRQGRQDRAGRAGRQRQRAGRATELLRAEVVTPGLVDAHSVVGLAGYLNQPHDQDQLEHSAAIQPELRAIDAYNARETLVEWVRGFGVTTVHTGHAPGRARAGPDDDRQDARRRRWTQAVIVPLAMVAVTLGPAALARAGQVARHAGQGGRDAARRADQGAGLRRQAGGAAKDKRPARDLQLEALGKVLSKDVPLLVTGQPRQRHPDGAAPREGVRLPARARRRGRGVPGRRPDQGRRRAGDPAPDDGRAPAATRRT